jgi:hypothetical protein
MDPDAAVIEAYPYADEAQLLKALDAAPLVLDSANAIFTAPARARCRTRRYVRMTTLVDASRRTTRSKTRRTGSVG